MKRVLIAGTGRAGTTLLISILTRLGLDTGFDESDLVIDDVSRCGLEWDPREPDAPRICKCPAIVATIHEMLRVADQPIARVFIPIRDITASATSRRIVQDALAGTNSSQHVHGGLTFTAVAEDQENVLLTLHHHLLVQLSMYGIPVHFVHYPRMARDPPYLHRALEPLLRGVSYTSFLGAFKATVNPEWIHRLSRYDIHEAE